VKKPIDLRDHLTRWLPDLASNPDKLHVLIDKGRIATRVGAGLGFEYHYQLQLIVTDFAESPDTLIVPLLVWVQANQPNLLLDEKLRERLVSFEAEVIDHDKVDIALTLELSERVLVDTVPGGYECRHIGEPPLPEIGEPVSWEIYLKGELIATGTD